jgi:hypothetical protein
MAATAIKSHPALPTEPATPLQGLHADRASLASELAGLQASAAKLRETGAAEAAAVREIGEMGSGEIAAMTAWASSGCIGDAPVPDQKQRRALAEKLSAAQSAAAAAAGAGQDIDHQIADLSGRLATIDRQINQATFDTMEIEHGHIIAQYADVCAHGRKLAAKIHGLASFYGDTGRTLISRGDQDTGGAYLTRAQALTSIRLADPGVSRPEIETAAHGWASRAETLRSGR